VLNSEFIILYIKRSSSVRGTWTWIDDYREQSELTTFEPKELEIEGRW
jgi:hypothetical protein